MKGGGGGVEGDMDKCVRIMRRILTEEEIIIITISMQNNRIAVVFLLSARQRYIFTEPLH